jgi:hypothetical protein
VSNMQVASLSGCCWCCCYGLQTAAYDKKDSKYLGPAYPSGADIDRMGGGFAPLPLLAAVIV